MTFKSGPIHFVSMLLLAGMLCVGAQAQESTRKIRSRVEPVYPEMAKSMRIEGVVRLSVTVGPNGEVRQAKVLGGNPLLANAAVTAVNKWRYEPGQEQTITVSVEFHR